MTEEAAFAAPPFEDYWQSINHPGQCQNCHQTLFAEWNGSMMANAWRDPAWRGAFLLSARQISTNGNCDTPAPPDGTRKARHNPFARVDECVSRFDLGEGYHVVSRPGSLVDGACSRCHMPTNYVDNVPFRTIVRDASSGLEHAPLDVNFHPTSDNGTGLAFATLDSQWRNTDSGKAGVVCMVCHSMAETRNTPYHNYARSPGRSGDAPAGPQKRAPRSPHRSRHPRGAGPRQQQPRIRRGHRLVPAVAVRDRLSRTAGSPLVAVAAAGTRRVPERRVQSPGLGRTHVVAQARGLSAGALDAGRVLQLVPRRDQPADDQEQRGKVGRRVSDRAHVCGVGEQPLRGSAREPELRPRLQARLPDLPHAAGLRAAGHRADPLQARRTGCAAGRTRGDRWSAADLLQPSLRRRKRLHPRADWREPRRNREPGAVSRALDVQFFLGGRTERLLERLLSECGPPRRPEPAGPARLGSPAQRARLSISPVRRAPGPANPRPLRSPWPTPAAGTTSQPGFPKDGPRGSP